MLVGGRPAASATTTSNGLQEALFVASQQTESDVLCAMMAEVPMLWRLEQELQLHRTMLNVAMHARSAECVAAVMLNCIPLQSRLLELMECCVAADREQVLPIICKHSITTDMACTDGQGRTFLHILLDKAEATRGRGVDNGDFGNAGTRMLTVLLEVRPDLHLLATNSEGLTALGAATPSSHCAFLLFDATVRMLPRATFSIIYSKAESYLYGAYAETLSDQIMQSFPGLVPKIRSMFKMQPGEEGSQGSFEILWEADHWAHSKSVCSRLSTGTIPHPAYVIKRVLMLLLGPAAPWSAALDLQEALFKYGESRHLMDGRQITPLASISSQVAKLTTSQERRRKPTSLKVAKSMQELSQTSSINRSPLHRCSLRASSVGRLPPIQKVIHKYPAEWIMKPMARSKPRETKFKLEPLISAGQNAATPEEARCVPCLEP